jgi:hypothetical protein
VREPARNRAVHTIIRAFPNPVVRALKILSSTFASAVALFLVRLPDVVETGQAESSRSTRARRARRTAPPHHGVDPVHRPRPHVGMASARTVTLHLRNSKFAMAPLAARGGGGVSFVKVQ